MLWISNIRLILCRIALIGNFGCIDLNWQELWMWMRKRRVFKWIVLNWGRPCVAVRHVFLENRVVLVWRFVGLSMCGSPECEMWTERVVLVWRFAGWVPAMAHLEFGFGSSLCGDSPGFHVRAWIPRVWNFKTLKVIEQERLDRPCVAVQIVKVFKEKKRVWDWNCFKSLHIWIYRKLGVYFTVLLFGY